MYRVTPGSLSRTPTISGVSIPDSRHFASSPWVPGGAVLSDHKTFPLITEACSGLQQKRAECLGGLIQRRVPSESGPSLPPLPRLFHIHTVLPSHPMDRSGLVTSEAV